jgi:hypothetical protein
MIYIALAGGLGNMLFQTAAALSFAEKKNTQVSFYNLKEHLNYLNLETRFNPKMNYAQDYLLLNMYKEVCTQIPSENIETVSFPFHFENKDFIEKDKIIQGFFQNEKYFKTHSDFIRNKFQPTDQITDLIKDNFTNILQTKNTTSVHVRRNDYVKLPHHHTVCSVKYYEQAINKIKNKTEHFFIFSDDPEWCKQCFVNIKNSTIMENNKDYIDLYLMSLCTNNIISNSTLAWWGAWLNNNKEKIVFAPNCRHWLGPAYNHWDTSDIIPPEWIQL